MNYKDAKVLLFNEIKKRIQSEIGEDFSNSLLKNLTSCFTYCNENAVKNLEINNETIGDIITEIEYVLEDTRLSESAIESIVYDLNEYTIEEILEYRQQLIEENNIETN